MERGSPLRCRKGGAKEGGPWVCMEIQPRGDPEVKGGRWLMKESLSRA